MLLDEQITKFQMLYKKYYGMDLSKNEAYEKSIKLLRLMQLTYKPMTKNEYDKLNSQKDET